MTALRFAPVILFLIRSFAASAQRHGKGIPLMEYRQRLIHSTMKFNEVRTRMNQKTTEKAIRFTQDSIFVDLGDNLEKGTWLKDEISFIVTNGEGKQIKYERAFGNERSFCFRIGDNKKTVKCYKKIPCH